jgi:hypothetical protein
VNFERLFHQKSMELPDSHSRLKSARGSDFRYLLKSPNPVQSPRSRMFPEHQRPLRVRRPAAAFALWRSQLIKAKATVLAGGLELLASGVQTHPAQGWFSIEEIGGSN